MSYHRTDSRFIPLVIAVNLNNTLGRSCFYSVIDQFGISKLGSYSAKLFYALRSVKILNLEFLRFSKQQSLKFMQLYVRNETRIINILRKGFLYNSHLRV